MSKCKRILPNAIFLLVAGGLVGCAGEEPIVPSAPDMVELGVPLKEQASFEQFVRDVVPILEARCGVACHGDPTDHLARPDQSAQS